MTDINKHIEEAKELLECIIQNPNSTIGSKEFDLIETSSRLLSLALHSSRWRKVSDGLPELGVEVLVTRNDGIRFLAWLDEDSELFFNVSGNEEYFLDEIQSWKPID